MDPVKTTILAFFEGLFLIFSPCILPVLPIILSSSLPNQNRLRPLGVITGFILSFTAFTYLSRKWVEIAGIDVDQLRHASLILLAIFACILFSDYLSNRFEWLTRRLANVGVPKSHFNRFEFINGLALGGLTGVIWTPCAGPILATVLLQTVLQQTDWSSFIVLLAFAVGAGLPMLLIALAGNKLVSKLHWFKQHGSLLRKILAIIILMNTAYIAFGNLLPDEFQDTQNINQNRLVEGLSRPYPAPALEGIQQWINSPPLTLASLKGKVVLIDFWTYSCINCVRTLPYIKSWYKKYADKGFTVIGVHTPEFAFESKADNVEAAVKKYDLHYPVAMDNKWLTWRNFNNAYWPAHYLIDKQGMVVYTHFGEGNYGLTENNIRFLLGINQAEKDLVKSEPLTLTRTPETYVGYERMDNFSSPESLVPDSTGNYTYPDSLYKNEWALRGKWSIAAQHITAIEANASVKIYFQGQRVFAVMGTATQKPVKVTVLLNGEPVKDKNGQDTQLGTIEVKQHDLYRLVVLEQGGSGMLELTAEDAGLEIYAFTFG